jgi:hypothetical protein
MYFYFIIAIFILILFVQNKSRGIKNTVKHLIKQSAKYATTAQQDTTLAISMRNANYASAYLHAAKDIASDSQIHNSTGIDVRKFKEHITNVQDMVTKKTTDSCPEFSGQVDIYLSEIAT